MEINVDSASLKLLKVVNEVVIRGGSYTLACNTSTHEYIIHVSLEEATVVEIRGNDFEALMTEAMEKMDIS